MHSMKLKSLLPLVTLITISSYGFANEIGGGAGGRDIGRGGNNNNYVVVPYDMNNVPGSPNNSQPVTIMNGPNGSTQTQVGTTTYYSPGGSSVTNGNRTIYSNGTNCVVQGNKKTCN
jgi:hypothetical protein